jgi:hypothetical protein
VGDGVRVSECHPSHDHVWSCIHTITLVARFRFWVLAAYILNILSSSTGNKMQRAMMQKVMNEE